MEMNLMEGLILFMYGLFNNAVSSSVLNDGIISE
jgi:hypothetical protein